MRHDSDPGRPPVVAAPRLAGVDAAADWVAGQRPAITDIVLRNGAVLLRGLPVRTAADFAFLRDRLIGQPASYVEKATPRKAYGDGVFTATEVPARRTIRLHNENSYATRFPGTLVFGCLVAPDDGGATVVGDMRRAAELLPADLVAEFRAKGWTLVRNYWGHFGLTWQEAFGTDDRAAVETYAEREDVTTEWHPDRLTTTQTRSAVISHPATGAPSWFNHVAFWSEWSLEDPVREMLREECGEHLPFTTRYGDGTAIPPDVVAEINRVLDAVTVREPWRPGDLMVVDNIRMAHGRESYRGQREVLVAMGDPVERAGCELAGTPA